MPKEIKGEYVLVGFLAFWGLFAIFVALLGTDRGIWSLFAFLGAAGGAAIFFLGFRALSRKRLIENIPTSKCRSVAMGFVEVAGKAAGKLTIRSPIGQIPCYCSEVTVERQERRYNQRTKKHETEWVTVQMRSERVDFYVEDETGRVRVNPAEAELDLACDLEYETTSGLVTWLKKALSDEKVKDRLVHDMFQRYCETHNLGWGRPMRFWEHNLCPGGTVYVLGMASERPQVENEQERLVITKGKHHPWFFIAEASQKQVLAKLGRHTWLYFAGGMAVFLICVRWLLAVLDLM